MDDKVQDCSNLTAVLYEVIDISVAKALDGHDSNASSPWFLILVCQCIKCNFLNWDVYIFCGKSAFEAAYQTLCIQSSFWLQMPWCQSIGNPYGSFITLTRCLGGKVWYLQHSCVGDTIVYHWDSELIVAYMTLYGFNQQGRHWFR